MKTTTTLLILASLSIPLQAAGAEPAPAAAAERTSGGTNFSSACSSAEKWQLPTSMQPNDAALFTKSLKGEIPAIQGFSQGLALRQFASQEDLKALGEYWISHSLFDAKLLHGAWNGFRTMLGRTPRASDAIYQLAALECLLRIQSRYPSLELDAELVAQVQKLAPFATTPQTRAVIAEAAGAAVRVLIARPGMKAEHFTGLSALLQGNGAHELLARGLIAARVGNHSKATSELDAFLQLPSHPDSLKRFQDHARILAARGYYSLKRYPQAVSHLKAVRKSSNELADTLSELAWAHLMDFHYDEAIGTAMNLQTGGLRRTFAPEGPMVMAIAMNEICQYPDSVRAIRTFQKNYEPSHRWLSHWNSSGSPLYPEAIAFLKKNSKVPDRIASEWVRSPVFISHQDELNLLLDEKENGTKMTRSGSELQLKMAGEAIEQLKSLKPRFAAATKQRKPGETLPKSILQDVDTLKRHVMNLRRLQRAAPVWLRVLASQQQRAPERKTQLIAAINKDLHARTERMTLQLEEIAENVQLIEIEIYNGATHDIIWQNAHPDYKKVAEKMKNDTQISEAKTWNWGRLPAAEDSGEIWEDELGSFKANLYDNCESKDRYLALTKGRRPAGDRQ